MSFKRMWMYVCQIHAKSKKPKLFIIFDMLWCVVHYGIGYLEYHVFGFAYIHGKRRKTFMTMHDSLELVRQANSKEFGYIFDDKIEFNKCFQEYIGRAWLDLRKASITEFEDFVKDKNSIFVKEANGFGGVGADCVNIADYSSMQELYDTLVANKQFVVEECIKQHSKMNTLCASSVNTIRIVTFVSKGVVYVIYSLIRIGNGKKHVDNISSGGLYSPVNENGIIYKPSFCDKTGLYYENHPVTNTKLVGFEIPYYPEAIALIKKAALKVPEIRYVGWDVAICETGPILIEGNTIPGYDMCQNYYHLEGKAEDKIGIWPKFEKILKNSASENEKC
ncbi:MAG TPA: sugar-transfer associated ATP-grasp domain-containing protein [Oscillospiraceae bacterium]|nr:sugar-transfer associated ATP-grasp domain-containing protein [Oscillospiraceae bacterium]